MINSPFNYTGSKFKLLNQLLPNFDYSKPYFIDLFCGGGSVYTNILDKYQKVIVNDIITDLVNIHESLLESDDIIDKTKILCVGIKENQDKFLKLREDYNNNPTSDRLWALMLSCNSNLIRFNKKGKFNQTWGKRSWNDSTQKKLDIFKHHIRKYKDNIRFTSKSFKDVEVKSDKVMVYIDPPYGYIINEKCEIGDKQISEAGYNNFYYKQDDINLYKYCKMINDIGSSFMISGVLEHGGQRSWLLDKLISDGFRYIELDFNYDKINKSGSDKKTKEVIIMNY
jgi:DNA adenine methylase Dam